MSKINLICKECEEEMQRDTTCYTGSDIDVEVAWCSNPKCPEFDKTYDIRELHDKEGDSDGED
jgi:hypothetical protein